MASARQSIRRLDRENLTREVNKLVRSDAGLRSVVRRHGPPPLWARPPGISTLIRIVLEQQVSLASGRAMYHRIEDTIGGVTSENLIRRGISGLRRLGVTRQKAGYCVEIARMISAGELNLRRIASVSDEQARAELQRIKGIGPWTADIYLLMALRRPDIWPTGDLALMTALQVLRKLPSRPTHERAERIVRRWSPRRAVAARILWHGYLRGTLAL